MITAYVRWIIRWRWLVPVMCGVTITLLLFLDREKPVT